MENFLFELGLIILIATILGLVARLLKQPTIIAYILAGIVSGPIVFNIIQSYDTVYIFAKLGVLFLLFMVGMNLNSGVLKEVGKISVLVGLAQVFFTYLIGYFIGIMMGLAVIEALYVSIALTFSSTIIIIKLLTDKNDIDSLYGKISVGFLLVQDFIVIFILVMLSGINLTAPLELIFLTSISKLALLFVIAFIMGKYIVNIFIDKIAGSQEILLLFGISWMVLLSYLSYYLGFSIEIGALLAGISLAKIPYHYEIENKIKSLRDFFLVLFFVLLGSQMTFALPANMIALTVIFSVFVIVGNPLIVMVILGLFGYRKRTSLLTGLNTAQISEFSLVLVTLGLSLGHITEAVVSLVTIVGILTIMISSYLIIHNDRIYKMLESYISVFERKKIKEKLINIKRKQYDIIILGYHRMGYTIMKSMRNKSRVLIIDFNPSIIKDCRKRGYNCIYGDISDEEVLKRIISFNPKVVVSTIPNFEDNLLLIKKIQKKKKRVLFFVTTNKINEALSLYRAGADYVILPHFLGGDKASNLLQEFLEKELRDIHRERDLHIEELREFKKLGQMDM